MIEIKNSKFDAPLPEGVTAGKAYDTIGICIKDSVSEDVLISNCDFTNGAICAICGNGSGKLIVEDCTFDCSHMYNPINCGNTVGNKVGSVKTPVNDITVKNCKFDGACHNYINIYQFQDNAKIVLEDNEVTNSAADSEFIRLSNWNDGVATIDVNNNSYAIADGLTLDADWGCTILMEDDNHKTTGNYEKFENLTVNFANSSVPGSDHDIIYYVQGEGTKTDNEYLNAHSVKFNK